MVTNVIVLPQYQFLTLPQIKTECDMKAIIMFKGNGMPQYTAEVPVIANQIYLQRPVLLVYIIILTCNGR